MRQFPVGIHLIDAVFGSDPDLRSVVGDGQGILVAGKPQGRDVQRIEIDDLHAGVGDGDAELLAEGQLKDDISGDGRSGSPREVKVGRHRAAVPGEAFFVDPQIRNRPHKMTQRPKR